MPKTLRSILRAASKREKKNAEQKSKRKAQLKSKWNHRNQQNNAKNRNKHQRSKSIRKSNPHPIKIHLANLANKQNKRKLLESQQLKTRQQKSAQRRAELHRNRKPKTLEYIKAIKAGNPRQVKGLKSKLTALEVSYYRQQESNEEEEPFRDSYFAAKIIKLPSINKSMEMRELQQIIGPLAASLPHVLLHKKKIFQSIIDFINNEAHKHILRDAVGLLIELAKDIRQEFMCFMDDVLLFLVQMLEWKVTNLINFQTVFSSFSLLLRYLEKYMKTEDITRYYKTYFVRFIGNKNYYIRDFMAEVFANIFKNKFLLNYNMEDNDKIIVLKNDILSIKIREYLYETKLLKDNRKTRQYLQIGHSVFLFQMIRGILKGFHSKTVDMLPLILSVLRTERDNDDHYDEESMNLVIIFREFVDLCAVYTNPKHALEFFAPLYSTVSNQLTCIQKQKVDDIEEEQDVWMIDAHAVDSEVIDQFVQASNNTQDTLDVYDSNNTFETDLDYLNKLLSLFSVWCSHNVGEVVPNTALKNVMSFIKRLTNNQWINRMMKQNASQMKQIYIQRVMEIIVSCCKIYAFQNNAKFKSCAQNGIKTLLKYCESDTKIIRFIIQRLGQTKVLLDRLMTKYLVQWIEKWGKKPQNKDNDKEMTVFLEFIQKTQNKKSFDLDEESNIVRKVKEVLFISNAHNVRHVTHEESQQIQEYLPMIRHFPNQTQWIESITNFAQPLMLFITSHKYENYRFALFGQLHNVLVELLIQYLHENKLQNIQLPTIIHTLPQYWSQYFTLMSNHPYNTYLLEATLNFLEFIQSFYVIFDSQYNKKLNKECSAFKDAVNEIMSRETFYKCYPLLLRHLCSANMHSRRAAIDILCLFDPETRFIERDHFGTELKRSPILTELRDVLHDDWGPSLERERENKVVKIISFAKGIDISIYHKDNNDDDDIMESFRAKRDGIKLGERTTTKHHQLIAVNESEKGLIDYQLQAVIHVVFGLLRINYRPLWSHSIELLFVLSERYPKRLWNVLHDEILVDLMQITHVRRDIAEKLTPKQKVLINSNKRAASRPLQVFNFIFEAINKNHEFAAMHIEPIVVLFLKFMNEEYHLAFPHEAIAGNYGLMDDNNDIKKGNIIKQYKWIGSRQIYKETSKIRVESKLRNFLSLFSTLAVDYRSKLQDEDTANELRDTFYRLLLLKELDLQKMTLAAYVRFYPQLAAYYSNALRKETSSITGSGLKQSGYKKKVTRHRNCSLKSLLKINTLKAGLVNFNMIKGDVRCAVHNEDRKYLVPVVIRILYNKLFEHQKRKVKSSVTSRRLAIISYISTLEEKEIAAFLDILHHSFARWMLEQKNNDNDTKCSTYAPGFAAQHQYISIIRLWQKCCPMAMGPFIAEFAKYLTMIFKHSYQFFRNRVYRNGRTFKENEEIMCRRNYKMCLEILRLLIQFYGESVTVRAMLKEWMIFIKPYLFVLLPENKTKNDYNSVECIWTLWKSVSRNMECCNFFDMQWPMDLLLKCFDAPHLSKYTHKSCLKILKNLMTNKETMRPLFIKYCKPILHSMIGLVTKGSVFKATNNKNLPQTELNILVYLADIIDDSAELEQLTDSLIPYLVKCKRKGRVVVSILQVLTKLLPNVANYQTWAHPLCDILNYVANKLGRSLLCELLLSISSKSSVDHATSPHLNTVSWLRLVAPTLLDLNCVYIEEHSGNAVPFGLRRLRAYDYLSSDLLPQLNFAQLKLITSTILYDIGHTEAESSVEMASIAGLKSIIEYDYINHKHLNPKHLATLIDEYINDFILKHIQKPEHRTKFLPLLSVICESRPYLNGNLHVLCNKTEQNFFTLMASAKEEDTVAGLDVLRQYFYAGNSALPTLNDRAIVVLIPIIRECVYVDGSLNTEIRGMALNVLGNMAQCACWIVYKWLLDKFMTDYKRDDKKNHINYRITALEGVMRITRRFHFEVSSDNNLIKLDEALSARINKNNIWESIDEQKELKEAEEKETMDTDKESESKQATKTDSDSEEEESDDEEADLLEEEIFTSNEDPLDMQMFMYDTVLVPLMQELKGKTKVIQSEHVHILSRVSVTVVFIAKYLPKADFDGVFLTAISTLCQFLQSKIPKRREKARKMLCDILKAVGPKFFRYIVKEIESRTVWGRYKHILGYSVCDILNSMYSNRSLDIGCLDHAVHDITKILLHDIAGAIGAEKMLETRRYRGKEAEDSRAPQGFKIMAQFVTFNPHVHLLLYPIAKFASRTTDAADWRLKKIRVVLNAIKRGLVKNRSITMNDLIAFTYRMIKEQLEILNEGTGDVFDAENIDKLVQPCDTRRGHMKNTPFLLAAPNRVCLISATAAPKPCSVLMTKFCLELILMMFDEEGEWKETLSEYNMKQLELIPNLCLNVFHQCPSEEVHVYVFKIAIELLPYKLSTYSEFGDVVIEYALEAITRTNVRMKDMSLLLLSMMIKHKQLVLDDNMLDVILSYIREHVRAHTYNIRGAFTLLRSVLEAKMMSPLVYDLMFEIHEKINRLQSKEVTQEYGDCLTTFLTTYPLSDAAIKKHFECIIGGLEHPLVYGRLCSLRLICRVIGIFPVKVIDVYALVLFVSLVQKLANDNDIRCKKQIKWTLICLLCKVENDQFWEFWTMFEEWIKCGKFKLSMAAMQAGISFIHQKHHIITKTNYKSLTKILMNKGLTPAINQHRSAIRVKDYGQNTLWKPCYLALELLLSIYKQIWTKQPDIFYKLQKNIKNNIYCTAFNQSICLLDFPHRWIRSICCKMLGFYLSIIGKDHIVANDEELLRIQWISMGSNTVYMLCKKLCIIMQDVYISESLCRQTIKNLLFLALILQEKYLNELKESRDLKWMKELKAKQQKIYQEKMERKKMDRTELKKHRREEKKERAKEMKILRKEKEDWFGEDMYDSDDNDEDIDAADDHNHGPWIAKEDEVIKNDWLLLKEDDVDDAKKKDLNWRINEIFEFITDRIQCDDTSLDVQYIILEWFAAIVIKFPPYDLRLYDYYIITATVYMLKSRRDPSFGIALRRKYLEIEGKEFEPLNLRQKHRIEMYTKCCDLSQNILKQLKEKIGDSDFFQKYYNLKRHQDQQRETHRAEREKRRHRIRNQKRKLENSMDTNVAKKKRKLDKETFQDKDTNGDDDGDWVSFLWS